MNSNRLKIRGGGGIEMVSSFFYFEQI